MLFPTPLKSWRTICRLTLQTIIGGPKTRPTRSRCKRRQLRKMRGLHTLGSGLDVAQPLVYAPAQRGPRIRIATFFVTSTAIDT